MNPMMSCLKPALPDSDIEYYPNFLDTASADTYFAYFKEQVPWRQEPIKVFGKQYMQPRLTALYGNNNKSYSYSNITMDPIPFDARLKELLSLIEPLSGTEFTTCLLNLYRSGADSNGWHSDDEKELGLNPVIASISLGQERVFHMKHKSEKDQKFKLLLEHGSLLLMQGPTQHFWYHQIPKSRRPMDPRINLTFRVIK